ncbi:MAG TPA: cation:proton antiporter [Hyphomicrobiaceae bacterium]|nr:cation:proton antiporter [Hyphomicrobiaceae bacterium]
MAAAINVSAYSDALVVLGTAGIIAPLLSRWGLSPVVGYLGAGAVLGPLGLGSFVAQFPLFYWLTVTDAKNVAGIADLGVVFLLFLIGLELSIERLITMRRLVFGLGGLQIAITSIAIAGIISSFGMSGPISMILGGSLALSSTAIVLEVLSREDRLATVTGRVSFSILLAQDLAVVPLLIFISLLATGGHGSAIASVGSAMAQAFVAISVIILIGRLALRPLFRLVSTTKSNELFIAATLFVVILTGVIAAVAGLSMALGTFIAGLLLAGTEYRRAVQATIEPFKGLLLGMFFFTVGMSINVREVIQEPHWIIAAVAALIVGKAIIVVILAQLFKLSKPVSIEAALLLGPGGEFAFVGVGLAATLGIISSPVATFTLTVTSLSMVLIPVMAIIGRHLATKFTEPPAPHPETLVMPDPHKAHAIVVGYGRMGKVVSDLFKMHDTPYIAIDHNGQAVADDRHEGHDVYFGDATNRAYLEACGVANATCIIVTVQSPKIIDEIVAQVRALRPDVTIVSRARDGEHARHLYATGVNNAVPETVEASLQLSRAALLGMGMPQEAIGRSIKKERQILQRQLLPTPPSKSA